MLETQSDYTGILIISRGCISDEGNYWFGLNYAQLAC